MSQISRWLGLKLLSGITLDIDPTHGGDNVREGGGAGIAGSSNFSYRLRGVCTDLGSKAGVSMAPLSAGICRKYGVTKTVSQAWRIGRAVALQRQIKSVNDVSMLLLIRPRFVFIPSDIQGIPRAILKLQNGKTLFRGKIVNVQREVRAGFTVSLLGNNRGAFFDLHCCTVGLCY
jgi:DUF917 family protein